MKFTKLVLLLLSSVFLFGCGAGVLKTTNPTDLSFIAAKNTKEQPMYVDYYAIHEKKIGKELNALMQETLADDGFKLVPNVRDAIVDVRAIVWYFGFNEEKSTKKARFQKGEITKHGVKATLLAGAVIAGAPVAGAAVIVAGDIMDAIDWVWVRGEDDYFMATTFIIQERTNIKGLPETQYKFESTGGGHYTSKDEAIADLIIDAKQDLVRFLAQEQEIVSDVVDTNPEVVGVQKLKPLVN